MPARILVVALAALLSFNDLSRADELPWTPLSLHECGVDAYLAKHSDRVGSGVVIAVLDTGVDMGVPGLDKLPDGKVKVIDAQDFSGEGDVDLKAAVLAPDRDAVIHYDDSGVAVKYTLPKGATVDDSVQVLSGFLEESTFLNGDVNDINDNGDKKDRFAILVIAPKNGTDDSAVAYVDTNLDRDWSDEKPLHNYRVAQESFSFARDKPEHQHRLLTCAVNIFVNKRMISFHFDDGGHGTHVAGIAAGYRINGQDGFNGVAPGAHVISLKIGDNRLSGGATTTGAKKRAFTYAAEFAREHGVQVVCNLSFGIASEREGYSDIDKFLDRLCRENPNLIVCTSAGNLGPGLSSVGTPAAAKSAISVAALIPADTARDVLGAPIKTQVTEFSSRGGELAKPDISTPGYAASTVPLWNRSGDFFRGTSMASPYAAGLAALLVCDARAETSIGQMVRASWVKSALQRSGRVVEGFTPADFGWGTPDMTKAAELLRGIVKSESQSPLYDFEITTESPIAVDGEGPTAYWRGRYVPVDQPQVFTITPEFAPSADTEAVRGFAKRYTLRSTAPWCKVDQEQIYLRSEQSAQVRVSYDAEKLTEPGLYVGEVEMLDGDAVVEKLRSLIAVPYRFNNGNSFRMHVANRKANGWIPERFFIDVPAGATAMHVELIAPEGETSTAFIRSIYRPNGTALPSSLLRVDSAGGTMNATREITQDLTAGVWEICVTSRRPDETSPYELKVSFAGLESDPARVTSWKATKGKPASGSIVVNNRFDVPVPATLWGVLEGYRIHKTVKVTAQGDAATISVPVTAATRAVRITCRTSETGFAEFTDVAVNIFDPSGESVLKGGMSDRHYVGTTFFRKGVEGGYEVEIKGAFVHPYEEDEVEFEVDVDYLYRTEVPILMTRGNANQCTLYPGIPVELKYKLGQATPEIPEGSKHVGLLRLTDKRDNSNVIEVPIVIGG